MVTPTQCCMVEINTNFSLQLCGTANNHTENIRKILGKKGYKKINQLDAPYKKTTVKTYPVWI